MLVMWPIILLYFVTPYYKGFLGRETKQAIIAMGLAYTIAAPLVYLVFNKSTYQPAKSYIAIKSIIRLVPAFFEYLKKFPYSKNLYLPKISEKERVAILFLVVKIFFLPIMLNFLFINYHAFRDNFPDLLNTANFTIENFNKIIFPILLTGILLVDTAYFVFGYLVESKSLNNEVRSVEPTFIGWASTIICYPPFAGFMATIVIWHANDYVLFWSEKWTFVMRIVALVLMTIYTLSSVALGAKCSNLTNRGIVTRGPYAVVRHPAYVTKNLAWWITILPIISVPVALSMAFWSFIYFIRSITEERHLIRDPDYQLYCKKVRYRFIPGLI